MAAKDYQRKNLKNPFFQQQQKKKKKKFFIFLVIFFLLISALIYFFFYSSLFILKNVKVIGADRTDEQLIKDYIYSQTNHHGILNIRQDNLWWLASQKITKEMISQFDLSNISIKKLYPQTIEVRIEERQAAFVLKINDTFEHRDKQACPISDIPVTDEDLKNQPLLVKDNLTENSRKNCLNLADDYLEDIFSLFSLSQDYQNFSFDHFLLNGDIYSLTVILKEGPRILFSRRENSLKQLEKLRVICQEVGELNLETIDYIDVRYGDKAFINYK